ncbi:protein DETOXIFICATION 16-like isoform X1 [Lotus japonicus]|uniref:protein DETOXIFICATION 16-like isoform X1 n=1 Tax=Lotus japonicus TaxID=34305 RepID=UPI00258BFE61|nr:protein DETOXIFICATION 16-like isoform X1 [Lotus japonicus]XP_057446952.1 protein DETOXIFICATION 16-like isoform X1 [Lotus japonicus]
MESEHQKASLHSPLIQSSRATTERREVLEEVKKQLWLAGPLICVSLLNYSLNIISVMFVGHLGELALSGASMATSFASVTGFSFLVGMASALDTLCGQSYGAKQYQILGIHMQRAMFILMIVSIPLAVIWANTRSILVFLGQDPEISTAAGEYAKLMVPSLFGYGLLQCLNRFLQTQNIVFPMMLISGVTTSLHFLICWIMVFKSGLGYRGAAVANSISYWVNVFILSLYVKFSPSCKKTWTGFSRKALHSLPTFLRLAIPSAAMICLEMWSFEMMVLLSGILPNPKLETSVLSIWSVSYFRCFSHLFHIFIYILIVGDLCAFVSLNTASTVWMIPFGLSGSVSIRVSNELGAGHPRAARLAVSVVSVLAIVEGSLVATVLILIRNIWGYAYSNEVEVVKYVATMMPILAISHFIDAFQSVLSGTARGCGWQTIGAFVNLGSYYLVGIPSAIVLAFVLHLGGKGLWLGIVCALTVQLVSLMIITTRTDWEQEAKKATDRVYDSIIPETTVS